MYNRYVPQSDGTYRRSRLPDNQETAGASGDFSREPPQSCCASRGEKPGDFLKHLLPPGFDTGDLLVVVLLLLIAGDGEENRSRALMTLALYFIM